MGAVRSRTPAMCPLGQRPVLRWDFQRYRSGRCSRLERIAREPGMVPRCRLWGASHDDRCFRAFCGGRVNRDWSAGRCSRLSMPTCDFLYTQQRTLHRALRVQLDDVAIRDAMLVPDLLSFESGLTPDACVSK